VLEDTIKATYSDTNAWDRGVRRRRKKEEVEEKRFVVKFKSIGGAGRLGKLGTNSSSY
jgi:hypothetical protein